MSTNPSVPSSTVLPLRRAHQSNRPSTSPTVPYVRYSFVTSASRSVTAPLNYRPTGYTYFLVGERGKDGAMLG